MPNTIETATAAVIIRKDIMNQTVPFQKLMSKSIPLKFTSNPDGYLMAGIFTDAKKGAIILGIVYLFLHLPRLDRKISSPANP
jgi:hypothetical protein